MHFTGPGTGSGLPDPPGHPLQACPALHRLDHRPGRPAASPPQRPGRPADASHHQSGHHLAARPHLARRTIPRTRHQRPARSTPALPRMHRPAPPGQHRPVRHPARPGPPWPGRPHPCTAAATAARPVPERHPGRRAVHHRAGRMDRPAAARLPPVRHRPLPHKARHTPAEQEWFRGYTEPITRRIAQLATAEPCHVLDSDSERDYQVAGMNVSGSTTGIWFCCTRR